MNGFLSILLLRGRLSRVPYALIAGPILLLRLAGGVINTYGPLFFAKVFHATLMDVGVDMGMLYLVIGLLQFVLIAVSFNRLHDIGLTGFLALPYLFPLFIGALTTVSLLNHQIVDPFRAPWFTWLSRGIYWYDWGLRLFCYSSPAAASRLSPPNRPPLSKTCHLPPNLLKPRIKLKRGLNRWLKTAGYSPKAT